MENLYCTSCGRGVTGDKFIRFLCPKCNKEDIIRCPVCRKNSKIYVCKKCGFTGP
ncbi:MAG: RNA-binding protein [Candidatus Aenigmatarchaeota archaeon]|nr:MAG: RNA-binding protein [Candidatus Aenigmarchaeota archaeon]